MKEVITFELEEGRKLDTFKKEEIQRFNELIKGTSVELGVREMEHHTYIIIRFNDESKS